MRARSSKRQPKSSPRLFHGPIDWFLVLRRLVIVNRNRLLANDHCELDPPASALLGLERRDLEVGLLCGAARADHRAVRKVKRTTTGMQRYPGVRCCLRRPPRRP